MIKLRMFSATWCQPCKQVKPAVEALAQVKGYELEILDMDENPEMFERYGIRGVPALSIEKDGDIVAVLTNANDIRKAESFINN